MRETLLLSKSHCKIVSSCLYREKKIIVKENKKICIKILREKTRTTESLGMFVNFLTPIEETKTACIVLSSEDNIYSPLTFILLIMIPKL